MARIDPEAHDLEIDIATASVDLLYACAFWKPNDWQQYFAALYSRICESGDDRRYVKNELGQRLKVLGDISVSVWLDTVLQDTWCDLLTDFQVGNTPRPGPREPDHDCDTLFNFGGWFAKSALNAGRDDLSNRAKLPRLPFKPLDLETAWELYRKCGRGKNAVRAWFSRRFNRHTPHPLVVHAKDYFLSTGKHRDPAELDNYQSDIWTPERLVNVAHALTSLYHQPKKHRLSPDGKRGGEIINDRVFHQDVQSELDLHAIQNEPHLEANEAWKSIALYPLASDTIGPFSHLRKALKTLNTNERETLKTYYSDGKTDAQAAKQFGVSTSAFNKRRERVQNKLAHEFRILRFPRRDNLALIDLSALSGKEWRNLLYGHQESTHPLEFRRDDLSYFTNATSLVSGRNPKPFFENPADPWNTKQSPHYKQPANTEPRPERPAAIRFISLANGIFHDGPHEFLTITEWHDLGKTIYSPAIVSNCVDRLAEMHPKKRGKTTGHPAWFYDALKRSFWFSAARLCVDKQEIRLANLRGNHYQQNRTEAGDADIAALLGISEQKAATLRGRVARRWLGRFRKPSARLPSGTRIDAAHSGVTAPKGLNGRRGRKAVDAGR